METLFIILSSTPLSMQVIHAIVGILIVCLIRWLIFAFIRPPYPWSRLIDIILGIATVLWILDVFNIFHTGIFR